MQDVASEMLREFEASKEELVMQAAQAVEAERFGHRVVQRAAASDAERMTRETTSHVLMLETRHDLHVQRITARVLARMQHRTASMALEGWRVANEHEKRRRMVVQGVLRRWRHGTLTTTLNTWSVGVTEEKRRAVVLGKVAGRWRKGQDRKSVV